MATTIITPPSPYSTVKESVIFEIDRDIDSIAEVMINGYFKQMPKNAFKVNVAHYFREDFTIVPLSLERGSTMHIWNGDDAGRIVNASISVDGVVSEEVPLLCADKQPIANRFMSDLRRRTITTGQIDEIPVYVTSPSLLICGNEHLQIPAGISYVALRVRPNFSEHFDVTLQTLGAEVMDRIEYTIEENDGVRLAWINAYGAIDYWNFMTHLKSSLKIIKEKIYTEDGYIATSIQSDTTESVISRPLPEVQVNVLSRIFVAESVWCIDGTSVCPIDITTENVTTYDIEKLSSVKVEYRKRIR